MLKTKYKYNLKTLSYEKVEHGIKDKVFQVIRYFSFALVFSTLVVTIAFIYIDSPKEKALQRENSHLLNQIKIINNKLNDAFVVLKDLEDRDDNIYRVIFEAEPIPDHIRQSGRGGVNPFANMDNYDYSEELTHTLERLNSLEKQIIVQSESFDKIVDDCMKKEKMLQSIPAIQPVANKDLTRMASGYGMRIHPIYKTRKMHFGMDFTAPSGTEIYATGAGTVTTVEKDRGYGKHIVIDHGYGYQTIYAHLSDYHVKTGTKVKRGEVIGYVGTSGVSTAPHLHYEVVKNDNKVNPINYYFNDLSPQEFEKMLIISNSSNQSFD